MFWNCPFLDVQGEGGEMEHTVAGQSGKVKCRKKARVISMLEEMLAEDDTGCCELKVFQTVRLILWKTSDDISVFQDRTNILLLKTNQCTSGQ